MLEEEIAFEAEVFIGTSYSSMTGIIQQVGERWGREGLGRGTDGQGEEGGGRVQLWGKGREGPPEACCGATGDVTGCPPLQVLRFQASEVGCLARCCLRPCLTIHLQGQHPLTLCRHPLTHQERFARGIPTTKTYVFAHTGG